MNAPSKCSNDTIAQGAYTYSTTAKNAQAVVNLANTVQLAADLIPF